ncbi:MAG: hypothetical protein QHC77_01735 [Stenotrophomonas sp.]|uniref:hypothetical protein n=1 Tax=Stenotrophomonas TaxID=40323 RepID=UPI0015FD280E|nr:MULTISPECIES: hypothetical protein [Stenotrophomonas]MDX3930648.1 hypothetical protein [Stenotrophomonas sp.]
MLANYSLTISRRPLPVALLYFGIGVILLTGWVPTLLGFRIGEPMLDLLFVFCSLTIVWRYGVSSNSLLAHQVFWSGYICIGAGLAVWLRGVHPLDFAQAYKFVWYMVLLVPFASTRVQMQPAEFNRLLNLSLFMFFSVYLLKRILGDDRPVLMTENNFEIIFLALLYFSTYVSGRRPTTVQTLFLLGIVVLSGSRSAAVAVVLAVLFSFDFKSRNAAKVLGGLFAGAIGIALAFVIFESRSEGGIETIDRFRFFLMFLESVKDWSAADYLLGADRLTPLPNYVCSQLAYYSVLFSYDNADTCYSVILHSFNLRILYDHGLIISALAILYLLRLTKAASTPQRFCVIGIVIASGLSVSALNNVYTAFGIGLFCVAASYRRTEANSQPA